MKIYYIYLVMSVFLIQNLSSQDFKDKYKVWIESKDSLNSLKENDYSELFNFQHPIKDFTGFNQKIFYQNSLTLYLVLNTKETDPTQLLKLIDLEEAKVKLEVYSNEVQMNSEKSMGEFTQLENGSIIKLIFKDSSQKKGVLLFEDIKDLQQRIDFYEIIITREQLFPVQKNIVETYLSIKYGVVMTKWEAMTNSRKDTLLVKDEIDDYSHHIFALGKDSQLGLNQKQSKNNQSSVIAVGVNEFTSTNQDNPTELKDLSYAFIGNNSEKTDFEWDEINFNAQMKRRWKYMPINSFASKKLERLVVRFDTNKVNTRESVSDSTYNDYKLAYYKAGEEGKIKPDSINNEQQIFYTIDKKSLLESDFFFDFVEENDFYYNYKHEPECADNSSVHQLIINVERGEAPFELEILDDQEDVIKSVRFNKQEFKLSYKADQNHHISITDSNSNAQKERIDYDFPNNAQKLQNSIPNEWYIGGEKDQITKAIEEKLYAVFDFTWYDKDYNLISHDINHNFTEEGRVLLVAKDQNGCECEFSINILQKLEKAIVVYPNPVRSKQNFVIELASKDETDSYDVKLYSPKGKLKNVFSLHQSNNFRITTSIEETGVYTILVIGKTDTTTKKIIIN